MLVIEIAFITSYLIEVSSPETEQMFLRAYDAHGDAIFRYCFFKLSDREQALDAVQEIFMRMWKYLQEGKEVSMPQAFLFVTASNYVKDQYRKKKAIPLSSMSSPDEDAPDFDVPDEEAKDMDNAEYRLAIKKFSKLSDDDSLLLQMRFVEDMAVKDIATTFGERENTVAVRISRALDKLRLDYEK